MLREPNLTFERAIALGQSTKQTKIHAKELKQEAEIYGIKFSKKENRYSQAGKKIKQCKYCRRTHIRGVCPAFHQTCNKCHKKGHFANVCVSTNKHLNYLDNQNTPLTTAEGTLDEENFFISAIFDTSNGVINNNKQISTIAEETNAEWSVTLNTNWTNICYKIDSGAQVNVLPENQIENLQRKPRITKSATTLSAYNGGNIPVKGECTLHIHHRGKNVPLLFIVANTNSPSIIGLKSSKQSNLIKRILSISNSQKQNFFNEYKDCFGEIGTLTKVHHITVDQNITPVVTPARKIPKALLDKLKLELQRMQRLDIIGPVNEPTEWVNPLIIVQKPNGKLRICLDPKHLNQAIKRQHYKLPTAEELFSEMHYAKFFTKLDASSGYWQIKVDEELSELLTFSTPFDRLQFKRLPYWIHSASQVFQKDIEEIIEGCEGARNSQDDIIIWGSTLTQLDIPTELVLNRIRKSGLKLNKNKCVFGATELIFLGHKTSEKGISPDPEKVKTIKDMSFPSSKQDLQRFLGMAAYLSKFVPQLSEETHLLRDLLKKNSI